MADFLQIDELSKSYPGQSRAAVDAVSLGVPRGELLALLGPSGCGKTTTLRMIAGLIEPTAGAIRVDGRDLTRIPVHRRGMGMVFQSFALFPHLSVAENVAFGLQMRRVSAAERRRRVGEVLERVELQDFAARRIGQLSGGQQQRVALARALVVEPSVLLLDEPLSALDAKLRDSLRREIRDIQLSSGTTAVFVTHDQDEALSMADRIAVMNDGAVEQVGTPTEIYRHPATEFVATFIGRANFLRGERTSTGVRVDGLGEVSVPWGASSSTVALVRPQSVTVEAADASIVHSSDRQWFTGTVTSVSYTGNLVSYVVNVGGRTLEAELPAGSAPLVERGTAVRVGWSTRDVTVVGAS